MSDELYPANAIPQPPQQMIHDMACGMEEPVDIAYRYGYSKSEYEALEQNRYFLSAVMVARAELERSGHPIKLKARWMADQLLDEMYVRAKNPAASLPQVMEAIRTVAKLGDLEPKANVAAAAGSGGPAFQVVINIPNIPQVESKVIETEDVIAFPSFKQEPPDADE